MKRENPYIPPETVGGVTGRRLPRSSAAGVALTVLLAVLLGAIASSQGRFCRMFDDFDVMLPAVSHLALSPMLPWGLALLLIATVVVEVAAGRRRGANLWRLLAATLVLATLAIYVLGVLRPFTFLQCLA